MLLETFNSYFHALTPVIKEKGVVRDLLATHCAWYASNTM